MSTCLSQVFCLFLSSILFDVLALHLQISSECQKQTYSIYLFLQILWSWFLQHDGPALPLGNINVHFDNTVTIQKCFTLSILSSLCCSYFTKKRNILDWIVPDDQLVQSVDVSQGPSSDHYCILLVKLDCRHPSSAPVLRLTRSLCSIDKQAFKQQVQRVLSVGQLDCILHKVIDDYAPVNVW